MAALRAPRPGWARTRWATCSRRPLMSSEMGKETSVASILARVKNRTTFSLAGIRSRLALPEGPTSVVHRENVAAWRSPVERAQHGQLLDDAVAQRGDQRHRAPAVHSLQVRRQGEAPPLHGDGTIVSELMPPSCKSGRK